MARTEKYFIGPQLLAEIRDTVTRVAGAPYTTQAPGFPFVHQELRQPQSGGGFRICTFTSSWSKGAVKTVTFRGVTSTPNTVAASNLFAFIPGPSGTVTSSACAIARDGTAWYVIAAEC